MISTIDAQFVSLIISVFAGLAGGCLFDLYRTINYYTRPSKAFLYFMDLLFWVTTGGVIFAILLRADFAQLRAYTFAGMAIGLFIYFKLFSEYVLKMYRAFIYIITKTIRIIYLLVTMPFKIIYNLLWTPANYVKKFIYNIVNGTGKWIHMKIKMLKFKNKKK